MGAAERAGRIRAAKHAAVRLGQQRENIAPNQVCADECGIRRAVGIQPHDSRRPVFRSRIVIVIAHQEPAIGLQSEGKDLAIRVHHGAGIETLIQQTVLLQARQGWLRGAQQLPEGATHQHLAIRLLQQALDSTVRLPDWVEQAIHRAVRL